MTLLTSVDAATHCDVTIGVEGTRLTLTQMPIDARSVGLPGEAPCSQEAASDDRVAEPRLPGRFCPSTLRQTADQAERSWDRTICAAGAELGCSISIHNLLITYSQCTHLHTSISCSWGEGFRMC